MFDNVKGVPESIKGGKVFEVTAAASRAAAVVSDAIGGAFVVVLVKGKGERLVPAGVEGGRRGVRGASCAAVSDEQPAA